MKAEIKPRIELQGRTRLEEVIPLATPFMIFLDPSSACNFQCRFCPTGNRELIRRTGRFQGLLDYDLCRKIVDDLGQFDKKIKVLRMYKDGEPLLNPKFPEMVAYAKQSGHAERVDTTTNAALLNPELNLRLVGAGLDRLNVSIAGITDEKYLEFCGSKIELKKIAANLRHFYQHRGSCEVVVKTIAENIRESEHRKFYEMFGDIADRIFIEHMAPCWPEFDYSGLNADFSVGIYGNEVSETKACPYVFYSISVNSDGTVSACFLDWERRLIVGDARRQSLREIWEGEAMRKMRIMMLEFRRDAHPVCRNCGQLTNCRPDNIDAYAETLLGKIKKRNDGGLNL
ncbi:MAG: radical SAM/SPASM domain-containing protein [Verrucomicrobiae bacterium]|nr:radical SAM/SPASM domain-containing protein [Verrucomicrobiae bacterium]